MTVRIPEISNGDDDDNDDDGNGNGSGAPSFNIVYSPVGTDENRLADRELGTGEEEEIDDF